MSRGGPRDELVKYRVKKNEVYGLLTVEYEHRIRDKRGRMLRVARCTCICTREVDAVISVIVRGFRVSCGCYRRNALRKYGEISTKVEPYKSLHCKWSGIKERCNNPNNPKYPQFGGKGIKLCTIFGNFKIFALWALAKGYEKGLYLERIDVEGDYTPTNCHFVEKGRRNRNKKECIRYTFFGVTKTLKDWSEDPRCAVSRDTLYNRLQRSDWPFLLALKTPSLPGTVVFHRGFAEHKSRKEWLEDPRCKVNSTTLTHRLRAGWSFEKALTTPKRHRPRERLTTIFGETKNLTQWVLDRRCKVGRTCLLKRIREGCDLEEALTTPPKRIPLSLRLKGILK